MPGPAKGKGGRPPIPNEQKRKRGTARADRTVDRAELVAVPPITAHVVEITVEQALERSLSAGASWIAESDALGIVILREAMELYAELKADPKARPADVLAALKAMSVEAGNCGFTPAERTRMGLAEVTAASKLEALRASRAEVADQDVG